jgi:two-component system, NarL family, sensor histidine kinase DegS
VAQSPAIGEQLAELRATFQQEQDRNRRELDELERMGRQMQSEVERLAQRDVSASSQLRNLLANLDRFSKEDIRSVFTMVQEVQMRLLAMRSQYEQLQVRQKVLQERQTSLGPLLTLFNQLDTTAETEQPVEQKTTDPREARIIEVIRAQENERLRISLQMHDGPVQTLSNLILRAEICERLVDRDTTQARSELTALKKAIHATLQETRRFIFDLRPMILDDLGLVPTLRRYSADFNERFGIEVSVAVQHMDARLPSHYEVALFRFIQEALNNVQKHAGASTARVALEGSPDQIQVLIEDNGSGFTISDTLMEMDSKGHMGFAVMRQQIETLLQGQLGVESATGRGTRVIARVPLREG